MRIRAFTFGALATSAIAAALLAAPGTAFASPADPEGCLANVPGASYFQSCTGVSVVGSEATAQARAEGYLENHENQYQVTCSRDNFDVIPRDGGAVQVNIYGTCSPN